jgi:hypothetical protein
MTKHLKEFAFKPGQSGNPNGRPKGSRNKLAETFLADVYAEWEAGGRQAVKEMVAERPSDFVRMVASLMPKEVKTQTNPLAELSDEELEAALIMVRAMLDGDESDKADLHH